VHSWPLLKEITYFNPFLKLKDMKSTSFSKYLVIICTAIITACVPAQKLSETEKKYKDCANERDMINQKLEQLTIEDTEMKQQMTVNDNQLKSLIKDSVDKASELERMKKDYDSMSRQLAELQESQETIMKGSARETAKLMMELQTTQEDLKKKEAALQKNEKLLNERKKNLDNLTLELDKRNARLSELEKILFKKDSTVGALKSKINTALVGFDKEDLTVKIRNGKVYVSLEEKLLFKSGSIKVDPKGIEALKKLAHVLEQNPDINVTIEGHTDNVPYKSTSGEIKDNWELSVQRALSIIRILQDAGNIEPKRFTASGRGEYAPIANNDDAKNRAKNRRTEIILTPKLDELFKILESN
jgi:chemotaxis protein MotB